MSNPLQKFQYAALETETEAGDQIYFRYLDSNGKAIVFQLTDFRSDPNDPNQETLIVDYEYSFLDPELDKDEFNRDFSYFVQNIIEESMRQAEQSPIDTSTKLEDIV